MLDNGRPIGGGLQLSSDQSAAGGVGKRGEPAGFANSLQRYDAEVTEGEVQVILATIQSFGAGGIQNV